jgi:Outer membrane protein beta-barrel domain
MNHRTLYGPLAAVLTLAACLLPSAQAQADASQGFYLGGGVGRYDVKINTFSALSNTITGYSANDTAYQFFVGYRFIPYLALEGQYLNLGTNREFFGGGAELTNKIYGWAPSLVGTLPLGSYSGPVGPVELFGRVGGYWYNYHTDFITPLGEHESTSNTYSHLIYGGGLGLVVVQRVAVRLEYDVMNIQNTSSSNALWLTAQFRF